MIESELLEDDAQTAAAIRVSFRRWLREHHQVPVEGSDFIASLHLVKQVRSMGGDPGPIAARVRLEIEKRRAGITGVERGEYRTEVPPGDVPEVLS